MTQYQKFFSQMVADHQKLFDEFQIAHDAYMLDPDGGKSQFNAVGKIVIETIREYERKLCATSEKGQYGKFSSTLSTKFWEEIKKRFPKIHFVGVQ